MKKLLLAALLLCAGATTALATDFIAFDNTDAGTAVLEGGRTTFPSWYGPMFTVGNTPVTIKSLTMPFSTWSGTLESATLYVGLWEEDPSYPGWPTNTAPLAIGSATLQNVTDAPAYYTVETSLGGYVLAAGHTYFLMLITDADVELMWYLGADVSCAPGWSASATGTLWRNYSGAGGWQVPTWAMMLVVSPNDVVPATPTTWGDIKAQYR